MQPLISYTQNTNSKWTSTILRQSRRRLVRVKIANDDKQNKKPHFKTLKLEF